MHPKNYHAFVEANSMSRRNPMTNSVQEKKIEYPNELIKEQPPTTFIVYYFSLRNKQLKGRGFVLGARSKPSIERTLHPRELLGGMCTRQSWEVSNVGREYVLKECGHHSYR